MNLELIPLYWYIGREIWRAQKAESCGTKVVERLAKDLAAEFPEMKGFSRGNLLFMHSFYAAWEAIEIVSQLVSKLDEPTVSQSMTQLLIDSDKDVL